VLSNEVLTSLLDRIYAATEAYPPTVTFNNELSIHEKRAVARIHPPERDS